MGIPTTSKFQFRDQWYTLAPPWLRSDTAERYMYCFQLSTDLLLEKMNQAIRIRLPGLGDVSQLPYLAHDRDLAQGPEEPDGAFATRLQESIETWALAGSGVGVLQQLQAYVQGLQPGVPATYPLLTLISGAYPIQLRVKWLQFYQGDAIGSEPTLTYTSHNFNWDGKTVPWRAFLVLPMSLVTTGVTGSSGATSTAAGGSFTNPGHLVSGVWVPATSGTPVNAPFMTLTGLAGLTAYVVGQWITISGSSNPGNNGTFPIVEWISSTSCVIANPSGVTSDAGPLTWTVYEYPWIGPGLPWGSPNVVWGQGELSTPAIDTGSNIGGVWQPSTGAVVSGLGPVTAWGLDVSPNVIISIRDILKTWKSAGTYYPHIIVAFDCGDGTAGNAYSPNSGHGTGNPDGDFGSVGKLVSGQWVPAREINSPYDAYCQGTGIANACGVENIT